MPQRDGIDTLVTTDLLIEDRHFLLSDVSPEQLGWKSAAVNISDIAAMGGKPTAGFLSIALPKNMTPSTKGAENVDGGAETDVPSTKGAENVDGTVEWIERFISGFRELSTRFGVPLLGGDTSASPDKLFINVTVLGECPHGHAVLRSGARPGDLLCVTGPLGDSAGGLRLVLERAGGSTDDVSAPAQTLISRHYMPMPRVDEGRMLAADSGVHAMMDISDGIASDLRHILKASGAAMSAAGHSSEASGEAEPGRNSVSAPALAAEVDLRKLPLSSELLQVCAERGWDAAELAVSGGEDYELLCAVAPEALGRLRQALDGRLFVIGCFVAAETEGIRWIGGERCDYQGFTHF